MPTIGTTSRPAYVYDQETDTWVPVGVGPHTHENFITSTTIDAKGDLLVGLSPDTVDRLGIGGNGTMLVADSTETLGMAWRKTLKTSSTSIIPLTLSGNATGEPTAMPGTLLHTVGPDATTSVILMDGVGGGSAGAIVGRRAQGTRAAPTATSSQVFLLTISGRGYGSTGYINDSSATIILQSTETFTNTTYGGEIIFQTVTTGTNSNASRLSISDRVKLLGTTVLEAPYVTRVVSGTSDTLVLADAGKLIETSNSSLTTITIPLNSSVPYPIGTQIQFLQTGIGQINFAGGGIALNGSPGTKTRGQWSSATLIKRGTDTWVVIGDLVP